MTDEKRSRVLGMILGSVSRGHFPQREPVAFLYGPDNVRLPKLPVVDGYDFHSVCTQKIFDGTIEWGGIRTIVYLSDNPFKELEDNFVSGVGDGTFDGTPETDILEYQFIDGIWVHKWTYTYQIFSFVLEDIIYTNYNLLDNYTGEIYLPKSNPVPVYE